MGRSVVKLGEHYVLWSSTVDEHVLVFRDFDDMRGALENCYRHLDSDPWGVYEPNEELVQLKVERDLELLKKRGTTSLRRATAKACVESNEVEGGLSWDDLVAYVAREHEELFSD